MDTKSIIQKIKSKLRITKNKAKTTAIALFFVLTSQAMGQSTKNTSDDNNKKTDDTELKIKETPSSKIKTGSSFFYGGETEARAGKTPDATINVMLNTSLSVEKNNTKITAGADLLPTTDVIPGSGKDFDIFTTQAFVELSQKLQEKYGEGELFFAAGKIKNMKDNSSAAVNLSSVTYANKAVGVHGVLGTTDNTFKVGYRHKKGAVELGWIGTSNESGVTIFDFEGIKGGKLLAVGDFKPNDFLRIKAMMKTDFQSSPDLHLNTFWDKNGVRTSAEFMLKDNSAKKVLIITTSTKLGEDLKAFGQLIGESVKNGEKNLGAVVGIEHKTGAFVSVDSDKNIGVGFRAYGLVSKTKDK